MTAIPETSRLFDELEALCAHDTTTGREDHGLPALRVLLRAHGAEVEVQQVQPGRHNVLATWGKAPQLLLSTHLDTVPPFLPPKRHKDRMHGRGTCDAKGQIVAQLAAIDALRQDGLQDIAWLGVVGEETDSVGAAAALALAERFGQCKALINGEPTENKLASGQRGSLQLKLSATGIAAHSGTPQLGRSAIWPLLDWLQELRGIELPSDAELGNEVWNLGVLRGGEAANVIPAAAEALLFVRSLPDSNFAEQTAARMPPDCHLEVVGYTPADRYPRVDGFDRAVMTFGSDAPKLRQLVPSRAVALFGPGSIGVAHTADEHITAADLKAGVEQLVRLGRTLLQGERR